MTLDEALAIGRLDGHDQAALVRNRELSALELTEAAILRIEALDGQLHAVSHKAYDQARAEAAKPLPNSPLAGVPWLVKDSLDYPGMPSRGGSRSKSDTPKTSAYPYVERLRAAGLVAVGKSAMPEFGLLPVTEPLIRPATRNPWSPAHSPGGSSGGAGAAVAAGLVPVAHGSDGAGSIRIPASCCGVVGLKPGRGTTVRVRSRHVIEDLLVGDGLMARSVRDVAAGFSLTHPATPAPVTGPDARRLRIAITTRTLSGAPAAPELIAAVNATAELCARLGHQITFTDYPIDAPAAEAAERTLWMHIGADCVDACRAGGQDPEAVLEPWTNALGHMAETLPVSALEDAYRQLADLPRQLDDFHRDYDVMLSPTLSHLPPLIGEQAPTVDGETLLERMFGFLGFTPLQNLAGTPAISLPLHRANGLPAGVMFAGNRGHEALLLALAFELDAALPWGYA
ncbi:MAG: amidase family protein [Asticcacaulis sp.]|uniref:amidase family protein n=1 Tax=Asticcacaulis sp. TaxID=1872648 RepID=UPI0039E5E6A2